MILQRSFYYDLSEEELARVHEYNFDHPGILFFWKIKPVHMIINLYIVIISYLIIANRNARVILLFLHLIP